MKSVATENLPNASPGSDLAHAWTLDSSFYTDPAILIEEKERLFSRSWQIVARASQLLHANDYVTTELCGEPLLLTRGAAGEVRGFYNVCRHRGGPPATGCGNRKIFRCGYHGWTYAPDGKLLAAPEMEGTEDFRLQEFGLHPVRVEEWEGLIFVNLDDNAGPFLEGLGDLPRQVAQYGFKNMKLFERRDYFMECNWKTYIDNYLEGYHLPSVHPSLNRELDYNQYTTELFEKHSLQSSPIRGPENEASVPRRYKQGSNPSTSLNSLQSENGSSQMRAEYFWVFPNWMLNCYPDNISLNIVLPVGPERCMAIFEWYFAEEQLQTSAPQDTVRFSDEIQLEDGGICEVVQRNLRSRSYQRGRYSVKQEKGLHHFHSLYAAAMKS